MYHADGRTDTKKITVAFRTSAKASNKNDSLSENNFEYLFYVLIIVLYVRLFCFRRNIPVTNTKDLSLPYTKFGQNKRKRSCRNFGKEQYKRRNKDHIKEVKMESTKEPNLHKESKPTCSRKMYNTKSEYPTLKYILKSGTSTPYTVHVWNS